VLFPRSKTGLSDKEITIAEVFWATLYSELSQRTVVQ
jgi:hypothetical protein